jgi:ankyrin repeat protein
MTGLQIAASEDKHKALLVMLDIFRQKREIAEIIDVANDEGRTPLMLASLKGFARCVDHLL